MAKQQKAWMIKPAKTSKSSVPDAIKSDLKAKAPAAISYKIVQKH